MHGAAPFMDDLAFPKGLAQTETPKAPTKKSATPPSKSRSSLGSGDPGTFFENHDPRREPTQGSMRRAFVLNPPSAGFTFQAPGSSYLQATFAIGPIGLAVDLSFFATYLDKRLFDF